MDLRHRTIVVGLCALAIAARPQAVRGQQLQTGAYDVRVGAGVALHQDASALVPASPLLSIGGRILVKPPIGLGFTLDYVRTETDDDVFPLAQFRFPDNDSTVFFAVTQPVAIFQYQFNAYAGKEYGPAHAELVAGVGGYTVYTDPQSAGDATMTSEPVRITGFSFSLGGSVRFAVSETAGIELSARDVVYTGYDRELLYPLREGIRQCNFGSTPRSNDDACQNERFPELNPVPPEDKSTLHNLILGVSFSFVP